MAKEILSDELWGVLQPSVPAPPPRPKGGRRRLSNRATLTGILFVLRTGIPWEFLPQEMGCGSGMTCWRRLREWQTAGVWQRLHQALLDCLGDADQIDWSRAALDAATVPAPRGGEATGPNPTDRGKAGTKRHIVVDRRGIPLAVTLSAANVNEGQRLEATLDAIAPIKRPCGRPRKRPVKLHADKAYDAAEKRRALRRRGIIPRIARRGVESSEKLGRYRWVVERTLAWLNRFRRLRIRYERRADIHLAFLHLGCALICWNYMVNAFC
jgi:transposase